MTTDKQIINYLKAEGYTPMFYDVGDLSYGGVFVKPDEYEEHNCPVSFDIIEITDLDGVCGASGQVLVQAKSTSFDFDSAQHGGMVKALDCCGDRDTLKAVAREDKRQAQLMLAVALDSYGISDPRGYGNGGIVAIVDRDSYNTVKGKHDEDWAKEDDNSCEVVEGWGKAALLRAVRRAVRM